MSDVISESDADADTTLIAMMPLLCHAALFSGISRDDLLDTVGACFDAVDNKFSDPLADVTGGEARPLRLPADELPQ